jgi:predicted DNA-binding transcriptional regulator AlpA
MPNMAETDLLTRQQAAAFLGVSLRTLDALHTTGEGPARVCLSAGRVAYRKQAIQSWLDSREQQAGKRAA